MQNISYWYKPYLCAKNWSIFEKRNCRNYFTGILCAFQSYQSPKIWDSLFFPGIHKRMELYNLKRGVLRCFWCNFSSPALSFFSFHLHFSFFLHQWYPESEQRKFWSQSTEVKIEDITKHEPSMGPKDGKGGMVPCNQCYHT